MPQLAENVRTVRDGTDTVETLDARIIDKASSLIVVLDRQARVIRFNDACEKLTGYAFDELAGQAVFDLMLSPADSAAARQAIERVLSGEGEVNFEADLVARDGAHRRVHWIGRPLQVDADGVELVVACGSDLTERRAIEHRLRESEERYALALRGANDGIWDWDLRADRLYLSTRWKAILGCDEPTVLSRPSDWFSRVHPDDLARLQEAINLHLDGITPHVEFEFRMRHRSGAWRWVLARGLAIRDTSGTAYRMAGSLSDVHERKLAEEQLVRGALIDSLTGLANRVLLESRIEHALAIARRNPEFHFAVIFLDLDRFKIINDGLGHLVGDQLLVEFSRRLASCVRPSDTVARLGGDEFVILLEDVRVDTDPTRVAQRIQELLRDAFRLGDHEIFTSASIGIVPGSGDYRCVADLLRDADAAMYRAKALGKNRYEVFDQALHEKAVETLRMENDLRRAIDRQEFELHYQPIVSMTDGTIRGFEALVRWRHPDRGLVSPALFIPVMEETGLIVPLGAWVIHQACAQMAKWRERFPQLDSSTISINVSSKQFSRGDLAADFEQALSQVHLPAANVVIEITESLMMANTELASAIFTRLRQRGAHIHVDDFGVGYSSLSQLHRLPIDGLKIDRSFVACIGQDGKQRESEIVKTILSLAKTLGMTTIAEGIETTLQQECLRALGCPLAQGYLLSRPLPAGEIENRLQKGFDWQIQRKVG